MLLPKFQISNSLSLGTVSILAISLFSIGCTNTAPQNLLAHSPQASPSAKSQVALNPQSPPMILDLSSKVIGYWVEQPRLPFDPKLMGKIYANDSYVIQRTADKNSILLMWADSLNCHRTQGLLGGNTVRLKAKTDTVDRGIDTTIVFQDANHALIVFQDGDKTYRKSLVKQRNDANVTCQ
jgi:hypothetical protein